MRPIRSLLIYIVVVFVGGALLAPWLYWLTQWVATHWPHAKHLANYPFHRYVDRCLVGVALIGVWPLLRSLGATSCKDVGLVKPSGQWKLFGGGLLLGFCSLAAVAIIVLLAHGRTFDGNHSARLVARTLIGGTLTAIGVAVLEEILFRGAIFGALRKIWNWRAALLISSMIYAITHFFTKSDLPGPVTWLSGLELIPLKLAGFVDLHMVIPGFFNLTLAGMLLGLAYQRTGNLYFSIGLHAGWIFCLVTYGLFTASVPGSNEWFWGTGKMTDGWLALGLLAISLIVLMKTLPDKSGGKSR